jgi:hypothetical protein
MYAVMSWQFEIYIDTDGVRFHFNNQHVGKSNARVMGNRTKNNNATKYRMAYPGSRHVLDRVDRIGVA